MAAVFLLRRFAMGKKRVKETRSPRSLDDLIEMADGKILRQLAREIVAQRPDVRHESGWMNCAGSWPTGPRSQLTGRVDSIGV